ncbi:MAG TPA: sodium/glutamate symporter [Bacillota bacterium]|nr:sodium/glutamate symporter [Bacillota bacterium]HPF42274.1 sodium/glutamate symporter [Bacillota bacterium]HPJ86108.1 sodium/glutamate symporter [Bacillota bacterium]
MLLPLGFGQGPGLAYSFGNMWSELLGNQGASLGMSYAFLGFVFGGTVGVLCINILSRKKGVQKPTQYEDVSLYKTTIEVDTIKEVSVLDGLTVQVVIISVIYGLVWGTLYLVKAPLMSLNTETSNIGSTIFGLMEGFNFIIGIGYALLYKIILNKLRKKNKTLNFMVNDYVVSNIASLCFNYMIAGAVLAITADFLKDYGILLAVVSAVGGVATLFYLRFITYRVYPNYKAEYFVGLFGMLCGVASTGIALLKGLDRDLESPVAEEMVLGSGTAITMALPLFAVLILPSLGYDKFGNPTANLSLYNNIALFGCLAFVLVMVGILLFRSRKKVTQ